MLTSALNFLSDKRKRFNRSDTVPVFAIDNVVEKDTLDEPVTQDVRALDDSELALKGCNITPYLPGTEAVEMLKPPSERENQAVSFIDGDESEGPPNPIIKKSHSGTSIGSEFELIERKTPKKRLNARRVATTDDFNSYTFSAIPDQNDPDPAGVQKFAQQGIRYYSPDGNLSEDLRTKPTVTNIRRSHSNVTKQSESNYAEKEAPSSVAQLASYSKNRAARLRSKVTNKSKLQRSRSSAQISRGGTTAEVISEKEHRLRSSSNQRDPSTEAFVELQEGSTPEVKQRSRKRGRTWIDRGRRSRSVNAFQKSLSPGLGVHKDLYDLLMKLTEPGTSARFYRIRVPDYPIVSNTKEMRRHFPKKQRYEAQDSQESTALEKAMGPAELALTGAALLGCSNASGAHSKLNRYAVVRRLRRNNSTINWTPTKQTTESDLGQREPSSQTAGDLVLPSRTKTISHGERTPVSPELYHTLTRFFAYVEQNKFDHLLKEFTKLYALSVELKLGKHNQCNSFGLSLIDASLLSASLEIILYLMALDFQLGPELGEPLTSIPTSILGRDPLKYHLTRCVGETEVHLLSLKTEVKALIAKTNELGRPNLAGSAEDVNSRDSSESNVLRTSLFAEIAEKERQIAEQEGNRKYLTKLQSGLNRFPLFPPAPNKVILMVSSPNSILVRITPPKLTNHTRRSADQTTEPHLTDTLGDGTSCESSAEESFSEGRHVTCTDSYDNLILKYRIEWSSSIDFKEDEIAYCIVAPPIRLSRIISDTKVQPNTANRSMFRTGFYELTDLQPGKFIFVRVYSYAVRGWSEPCYAQPRCIRPSSWFEALSLLTKSVESADLPTDSPGTTDEGIIAPLRYVGNSLSEEFRSIKQLLDQQILLWVHKPSTPGGTDSNSKGADSITDDGAKRTKSPMIQRKRSFRFPFTSKSIKFAKQTKSGVYLALVCHTDFQTEDPESERGAKSQIVTVDDCLPMICVTREESTFSSAFNSDISWFSRLLADPSIGPDLQLINEHLLRIPTPNNLQLRYQLLDALNKFQVALGSCNVGSVYPEVFRGRTIDSSLSTATTTATTTTTTSMESSDSVSVDEPSDLISSHTSLHVDLVMPQNSSAIVVLVRHIRNLSDASLSNGLRWSPLHKFLRQNKVNTDNFALESESVGRVPVCETEKESKSVNRTEQQMVSPEVNLLMSLDLLMQYSTSSSHRLRPGLYVTYVQMQARLNQQASILVSKTSGTPYMLPCERVRKRSHVTCTEWSGLCHLQNSTDENWVAYQEDLSQLVGSKHRFVRQLYLASKRLVQRLQLSEEESEQLRIYLPEVVRISPQHSLILLFPAADQVCLPPTSSLISPLPTCAWCSMTFFERNLGLTYDPIYHCRISSLLALLELLVPLSVFLQRQCINDTEWSQNSERTNALQSIQQQIEALFSGKRWLSEAIGTARDRKRTNQAVTTLLSKLRVVSETASTSSTSLQPATNLLKTTGSLDELLPSKVSSVELLSGFSKSSQMSSSSATTHSLMDTPPSPINQALKEINQAIDKVKMGSKSAPSSRSGDKLLHVLRVYGDYTTGLAPGTSVRVSVGLKTTAKEIVKVVIQKLFETAQKAQRRRIVDIPSDSGLLSVEQNPKQFCLIVSIADNERCLPESFRPLLLQIPWRDGRFSVRSLADWHSKTSPVRTYLFAEQVSPTASSENLPESQTTFHPLRSVRAKLTQVLSHLCYVKITSPPTVYLNGHPVSPVPK